jgi:uncharacterized protein (DUF488 family)
MGRPRTVFTAGYGNRSPDAVLDLLAAAGVRRVVDVRLRPDKARLAAFALASAASDPAKGIRALLARRGIEHVSLLELGNLFLDLDDWQTPYRALVERAGPILFERLLAIPGDFALFCAEVDPAACHRGILAEHLARTGRRIVHL